MYRKNLPVRTDAVNQVTPSLDMALSGPRMRTYLRATGNCREKALALHRWNGQAGALFHYPIQLFELTLRNSVSAALSSRLGEDRWFTSDLLPQTSRDLIAKTQAEGAKTAPDTIARLSLGFWVALHHKRCAELWRRATHEAYTVKLSQKIVGSRLNELKKLRNRIAHHEPVLRYELAQLYSDLLDAVSWMNPAARDEIEAVSTPALMSHLAARPA
ncbi:MAG: hypothetical protein IPK80_23755 [Nannocystis sp.]|nr:hypothetical protein [Nannocystis sp.]